MDFSLRPPFTPHLLRVRAQNGCSLEADLHPIMQPKLAVQYAYRLARFLARPDSPTAAAHPWLLDALEDLDDCGAVLDDCTVEVYRRVPAGYPGAVNGYALLLEVPVTPADTVSVNPHALRPRVTIPFPRERS